MDESPSQPNKKQHRISTTYSTDPPKMSMLAMVTPSSHSPFSNKYPWDMPPSVEQHNYNRQRDEARTVALPSIRQAFPELALSITPADGRGKPASLSPVIAAPRSATSPDYIHSPESRKRRRIANEDEQETLRVRQVPRVYRSPEQPKAREVSPIRQPRAASYATSVGLPSPVEMKEKENHRPTLPSLPPAIGFDRGFRERHVDDHRLPRSSAPSSSREAHAPFQDVGPAYVYHHTSRSQPLSAGAAGPYDTAPFSAGSGYGSHFSDAGRYAELGSMGRGGDSKQRKRRGNLPKETTDQLRAWFVGHLQHPYPTEDEKQELMRKTGLQMNQISNWFINARRRQLPAMISNARAESDVINSQGRDGKILSPSGRAEYSRDALNLSDTESGAYDDDMDRHAGAMKRGSV